MKLDNLCQSGAEIRVGVPTSNHEISLPELNQEFDELYANILADLPEKYSYDGQPIVDLESRLSMDYQILIYYTRTSNTLTDEESTTAYNGNYYNSTKRKKAPQQTTCLLR